MMTQKRTLLAITIAIIIIGGLYVYFDRSQKASPENLLSSDTSSTTIVSLGDGVTATLPKGYVVEPVRDGVQTRITPPSLSRPVVFASGIDPQVQSAIEKKITELKAGLTKDSRQFAYWIDLGTYHKVAGDFEGAKIYWDYAGKFAPKNFVSFGNLGDLYAYYLKDNAMAETSYKKAIANDPTQEYLYAQLAHVYIEVFKDEAKAKAILDQGLTKLPGNTNLLQLKATLK